MLMMYVFIMMMGMEMDKIINLYIDFKQLIFIYYNVIDKYNSNDGTIEYFDYFK